MNACTIVARNYLAQARVLSDSFLRHHADGSFTTLLLDDLEREVDEAAEPFDVVHVDEIGIEADELFRMAMIYDVLEFATAVKPWFLDTLLEGGMDHIVYFDPDIEVFAPLDDIAELAREHGIVLTPHVTEPMPRDGLEPSERTILRAGVHNLGFVAVGAGARDFLDWWAVRLARDCLVDPDEGQFVDQRWVDFVPSLFDHHVLRDPGCNVATWNLNTREVTWKDGSYFVNGQPLRFYHYSGFNPEFPHLLSKFQGDTPRIVLSDRPAVAQLCREYAASLLSRGHGEWSPKPYVWSRLPDGTRIDPGLRRHYRWHLIDAERGGGEPPPLPFDPSSAEAFAAWRGDVVGRPARAKLRRYAEAVYAVDPEALPARVARRVRDRRRAARLGRPAARAAGVQPGANVAGYFRAELGIGEAARQIVSGFEHSEIPFATITYDRTLNRQEHPFASNGDGAPYDTNVVCVNADQTLAFRRDIGSQFFRDRYSIGVWFWEIAEFPSFLHPAFEALDEVWAASDFVRDAVAAQTDKPVLTVPLPLRVPDPPALSRDGLGLPEDYLFLFSYDFLSVFERKNPLGLLEAFTRAFEPGEGPVLLLKSINGDKKIGELERLHAAAAVRPDVIVRDGYLSAGEKDALTAACDCYVSLHRSEGFGLTMAEAMACAKPVIATAYSGNLAFMTEANSYLVPYELGSIPAGCDPYPAGVEWAEPDLDEAARLMRHVWEDRDEAGERGERARAFVAEERSPEHMAAFLESRLGEIRSSPRPQRLRRGAAADRAAVAFREVRQAFGRARQAASATASATGEAPTALARARAWLERGPENSWSAPSRFGRVGVFGRRALHRGLRPYAARQRELEIAMLEALEEVTRLAGELDQRQRAESAALGERLAALQEELAATQGELTAVPYMADPKLLYEGAGKSRRLAYRLKEDAAPTDAYRGFEDIFRGPEAFIRDRQRVYLNVLAGHAPVLDVGCGRGELLELLAEAGIPAGGIDLDEGMVARCREKGLEVERAEAVEHLASLEDGSLGAVFSAQVVEHLDYEALMRFLELAHAKLAPGGVLVAETVNPHSIQAFKAFWVDLTHKSPIFPEVALAFCRLHGFAEARVLFPYGTGELESDRRTQGEYAVVATRASVAA